jgi:hypothetical protein
MPKLFSRDHACKYENMKINRKITMEMLNDTISTGTSISSEAPPNNMNRNI